MLREGFTYQLRNFETLFAERLVSTEENSVDEFFAEIAKEFIQELQDFDFQKYRQLDDELSFIDVDEEGQTRVMLAHKNTPRKKLSKWHIQGVEIELGGIPIINWFGVTNSSFAVVGNHAYFSHGRFPGGGRSEEEEKWDYSEIESVARAVKDNLENGTRIKHVSWKGRVRYSGVWSYEHQEFQMFPRSRLMLKLKQLLSRKHQAVEEVVSIDWH